MSSDQSGVMLLEPDSAWRLWAESSPDLAWPERIQNVNVNVSVNTGIRIDALKNQYVRRMFMWTFVRGSFPSVLFSAVA